MKDQLELSSLVVRFSPLCTGSDTLRSTRTMPSKSVASLGRTHLMNAPEPPPGIDLPASYIPKQCRRCGVWSTSAARYDQSKAPEASWKCLVAWGRGKLEEPVGLHCLCCKKAGMRNIQIQTKLFRDCKLPLNVVVCQMESPAPVSPNLQELRTVCHAAPCPTTPCTLFDAPCTLPDCTLHPARLHPAPCHTAPCTLPDCTLHPATLHPAP